MQWPAAIAGQGTASGLTVAQRLLDPVVLLGPSLQAAKEMVGMEPKK